MTALTPIARAVSGLRSGLAKSNGVSLATKRCGADTSLTRFGKGRSE